MVVEFDIGNGTELVGDELEDIPVLSNIEDVEFTGVTPYDCDGEVETPGDALELGATPLIKSVEPPVGKGRVIVSVGGGVGPVTIPPVKLLLESGGKAVEVLVYGPDFTVLVDSDTVTMADDVKNTVEKSCVVVLNDPVDGGVGDIAVTDPRIEE